jgi:hypothetical protein
MPNNDGLVENVVDLLLSMQPAPGFKSLFSAFSYLYSNYKEACVYHHSRPTIHLSNLLRTFCKAELASMISSIGGILMTLHKIRKNNPNDSFDSQTEEELETSLSVIEALDCWVEKQGGEDFTKVTESHP